MVRYLIPCVALLMTACSTTPDPIAAPMDDQVETSDDASTDGLKVVRFDVNKDKRPDIWKYFREETNANGETVEFIVRKELDLNSDGTVDVVRHYDATGTVTREELDLDFDKRFDAINYYTDGVLTRKEMDLNYDGKPDLFKYYKKGKLVRLESDKDYNGNIDYWEYYEDDKLDRIGFDIDGDGKVDRMERRDIKEDAS